MAGVWSASFVFGLFVCVARSQQIYLNENNECVRNDQTMLKLKEQINFFRQENARQIEFLIKENARIMEKFNGMLTTMKKNISNSEEDLKSSILKITAEGLNLKKDCNDLYINGNTKSGVYEINPSGVYKINPSGVESKFSVFCDMMVEGGGWTTIQKRVSGYVAFNRTWAEYKTGFGSPNDSYWIGNDVIHQLTRGRNSSLYVSITLTNGTKLYELYNQFSVDDETNNYTLFLGGPATGALGDAMLDTGRLYTDLSGMSFSTLDRDHDRAGKNNCAVDHGGGGGWWYNVCHYANLNGQWSPEYWWHPWYPTVTVGKEIKETLMMIKPH